MTMDLTVTIETDAGHTVYELSEDARSAIERRAEAAFGENPRLDYWWETYNDTFEQHHGPNQVSHGQYGDPVLVIETEGKIVPAENIVQPQQAEMIDASDAQSVDEEEESTGSDMMTLLPERDQPEQQSYSLEQVVRDSIETREEQIEDGRLPRAPEEEPEVPHFIQTVPEVDGENWSTAKAMFPAAGMYYWDVQARIDYPPVLPEQTKEEARQRSHERWQSNMNRWDCETVNETKHTSDEEERKPWDYSSAEADETKDRGEVGTRWNL